MAKLVFIGEEFDGRVCELAEGTTSVGRGDDNQIIIRDATVSTRHCQILVHGCEVIVREAGSRNGTWVQGVAVTGQMPVKSGQSIRFGAVEARLELERPTFHDPRTPETAVAELVEILAAQRRAARNSKAAIPRFTLERRPLAGTKDHTSLASAAAPAPLPNPVPHAAPVEAKPAGPPRRRWWRWWRWLSGLFVIALILPIPA
jgi:predicted component of type VI protein secretion system